ncbi:hypothetical protein [Agrobacterium sp. 22117]|uniref:hypothetical protein n=1 Tax=Agrobacterium sp. 22117 TaxID=3453880 RepID=UPI003F82B008
MTMIMSADGLSLEEGLSHSNPTTACLARMSASTFATHMVDFFNAELARGTNRVALLDALARFQVQTHACLAAQFLAPTGVSLALDLYRLSLSTEYIVHSERARATERKMRGQG